MLRTAWVLGLALLGSLGCVDHEDAPDGEEQGDGDGDGDGDGEPMRLADTLPIALDQVGSFVAQLPTDSSNASAGWRAGEAPQLFALTLEGEVIEVSLVEGGTGAHMPPQIREIYATPAWIIFGTSGFSIYELVDGEEVEIPCGTIVARRSDGALFCSALMTRSSGDNFGNVGAGSESVLSNAAGDVMYWVSFDELNLDIVYRVTADVEGLTGTLVDGVWRPNWMVVNASGDLLVNQRPAGADQAITEIHPLAGPPISVTTTGEFIPNMVATAGFAGSPDADDFYLLDLAQPGIESRVVVLRKQDDGGFVQTDEPADLPLIMAGARASIA